MLGTNDALDITSNMSQLMGFFELAFIITQFLRHDENAYESTKRDIRACWLSAFNSIDLNCNK